MGLRRFLRRQILIFPFWGRYVKVFWGRSSSKYISEVNGNLMALKDVQWSTMALPVKSFGGWMLLSQKGERVSEKALIVDYLRSTLAKELERPCRCSADELLDLTFLSDPFFSLTGDEVAAVKAALSEVVLPVSPSHGDLHRDNFIILKGELKIIDWAMYSEKRSFVLDCLHFYCREACSSYKVGWVEAIWLSIPEWEQLSVKCNVPLVYLRLLYSIDRISLELAQDNGLLMTKPDKYRSIVSRLVDSISPAP